MAKKTTSKTSKPSAKKTKAKSKPKAAKPAPKDTSPDVIVLPDVCDLPESEVLLDAVSDHPSDQTVVLDASQVSGMTTACALVVVGASKQRAGVEPPVAIVGATPAFIEAFQDLGLFKDMMQMEFRT